MNNIKLSIIIPMYNVKRYIRKCLDSIISQDISDCEVIIINDGSTDGSLDIAYTYKRENIRIISQKNMGQAAARNKGVKMAVGEYIMFIDSDDYILPGFITNIMKNIQNSKYDIVAYNLYIASNDGVPRSKQFINLSYSGIVEVEDSPGVITIPTIPVCKAYRREWLINNELFFPEGIIYEDVSYVPIAIAKANKILFLEDAYYVYIQHSQSTTHRKFDKKSLDILKTNSILLEKFEKMNIKSKYKDELAYIALETVISQVFESINEQDYSSNLQIELIDFLLQNYPNIINNKYLSKSKRKKYELACKKQFLLYHMKYILIKRVKRFVRNLLPVNFQRKVKRMGLGHAKLLLY